MVDAEEDARVARALDDTLERGDLVRRGRRETGLPEAGDPDRAEAGVLELLEGRPGVPDGVVDCADEEGLFAAAAAAAGEDQCPEEERTGNSALARTTTTPGCVAWTNVTESL